MGEVKREEWEGVVVKGLEVVARDLEEGSGEGEGSEVVDGEG